MIAARIAALDHKAKRRLSPPSSAWEDVNRQLLNVIVSAHEGNYKTARSLLEDAEQTFRYRYQNRLRLRYLLGFSGGVAAALTAGILIALILSNLEPSFEIKLLVSMFYFLEWVASLAFFGDGLL